MLGLVDELADLIERIGRFTRAQWLLRGLMLVGGVVAMLPLWLQVHAILIAVPAAVTLLLGLVWPRGHVATVFVVLLVLWALIAGPGPVWAYGVVALGCLAVHWAAGACAVGPSFAPVDPRVWRGLAFPAACAVAGVLVAVGVAGVATTFVLPPSLALVALTIAILMIGAAIVLTPGRERGDSSGT